MSHHERPRYVPVSTYRLQVHGGFPLTAARDVVPYLARLGVAARLHLAVLRGGARQHARLRRLQPQRDQPRARRRRRRTRSSSPRSRRTGCCTSSTSCRTTWASAPAPTRGGTTCSRTARARPSATFFDIDWTPVKEELHAKLLLPILGDQYGHVLERGELQLVFQRRRARAALLRPRAADQPAPGAARLSRRRSSR